MEAQNHLTFIVKQLSLIQKCLKSRPGLYEHSLLTANIASSIVLGSQNEFGYSPMQAYVAGILHDIGMMFVTDALHEKPDSLSEQEWSSIMAHPELGAWFVRGTVFEPYSETILRHHECQENGYPIVSSASDVPAHIRLIVLSDRLAAFLGDRPYSERPTDYGHICKEVKVTTRDLFSEMDTTSIETAIMNFVMYQRKTITKQPDFGVILGMADTSIECRLAKCMRPGDAESCEVGLCQRHLTLVTKPQEENVCL